ncbi:DUF4038 domain-containing protein [Chryseolinea soli]|uniref:DUF4038 domain-containing protein n=1 Tax=Chryseolinea soli TaxID=2321403 RepID=A0A385SKA7_9BACT|nr:DUF4038 domain-containing protein [Chryseolinea soli]AYB31669.1 DUF4038 domain-containing protein [Chryseolinea soli]
MKHLITLSALWLFLYSTAPAQKRLVFSPGKRVSTTVYQPVDIVFDAGKLPSTNPFDITFGATVTNSSNQSDTIYGFYNGGKEFVLRFNPTKQGDHPFQTFSTVKKLSALKGVIRAEANTDSDIHGRVKVSASAPQKFEYQDGTPYFALPFELDWLFALDIDNPSALPKTTEIVQAVKENGFNQIVMNVYAYETSWKTDATTPRQYSYKDPPYTVFGGTNEKPDFTSLNVSFFKHFDRVIQYVHERGIVAHVMIYVWNKKVNWPAMYSAEDNRYYDYIIKRYQAYPNVIWDVSKEALDYGRCDIPYINERIERTRKLDAYHHLVTVHDYEYCSREPDRVDFISIQNWRPDLYSLSLEAYLKHSNKPVMNIEHGGYEEGPFSTFTGNYTNAEVCLERTYACVFAGVYGSYYWQNTSWDIVIHDIMNPNQTAFRKPRFDYYKHLQQLFSTYEFAKLSPHKPKLTTNSKEGFDNLAFSGYALTDNKALYLYYVPKDNYSIWTNIPKPPSGEVTSSWFNIFTGETTPEVKAKSGGFGMYQSPWKGQSAVLILKAGQ